MKGRGASFDVGQFERVALAVMMRRVVEVSLPSDEQCRGVAWPPTQKHKSFIAKLRFTITLMLKVLLTRRFVRGDEDWTPDHIHYLAYGIADEAIAEASRVAGYGKATGIQRHKVNGLKASISSLKADGVTNRAELARRVGVSERTVYRVIDAMETEMRALRARDDREVAMWLKGRQRTGRLARQNRAVKV